MATNSEAQDESQNLDHLLGVYSWFIRGGMDSVQYIHPNNWNPIGVIMDLEARSVATLDRIAKTQAAFGGPEPEQNDPAILKQFLNQTIDLPKITILYKRDRYGTLEYDKVSYFPQGYRKLVTFDDEEELKAFQQEVLETFGMAMGGVDEDGKKGVYIFEQKFTEEEILNHLYLYYQQILNEGELKLISDTDDGFGYAQKAGIALEHGVTLYRHQVMGDSMWFEGLSKVEDGVYRISLGS